MREHLYLCDNCGGFKAWYGTGCIPSAIECPECSSLMSYNKEYDLPELLHGYKSNLPEYEERLLEVVTKEPKQYLYGTTSSRYGLPTYKSESTIEIIDRYIKESYNGYIGYDFSFDRQVHMFRFRRECNGQEYNVAVYVDSYFIKNKRTSEIYDICRSICKEADEHFKNKFKRDWEY